VSATVVRYRVKPGHAEENAALVREVYAELAAAAPPGFRYATFVAEDGVSFVHVALNADPGARPLTRLASFARFQADLGERCDAPPEVTSLPTCVGAYGW
jgi:hypothetical protein